MANTIALNRTDVANQKVDKVSSRGITFKLPLPTLSRISTPPQSSHRKSLSSPPISL